MGVPLAVGGEDDNVLATFLRTDFAGRHGERRKTPSPRDEFHPKNGLQEEATVHCKSRAGTELQIGLKDGTNQLSKSVKNTTKIGTSNFSGCEDLRTKLVFRRQLPSKFRRSDCSLKILSPTAETTYDL